MNYGYRLVLHKSIPEEDREVGTCALKDKQKGSKYTFKRLSKNRRIFGIIPIDLLEHVFDEKYEKRKAHYKNGKLVGLSINNWAPHVDRVNIKGGYNENDYETFAEVGKIKG